MPTTTDPIPPSDRNAQIRQTFLAGIFAFVPLAVTIFIVWWIDDKTCDIVTVPLFKHRIHFLGVLIALSVIYVTGMLTRSLFGKFLLGLIDRALLRLPMVRQLYLGWKQIALTPGGTEGTFSKVVLIPDESGQMKLVGFTSRRLVESVPPCYCVFVPSCPNPITGRLYFVPPDKCQFVDMSTEEAFKMILSTGNYVPPLVPIPAPTA